jgi:hypothetical protein
MKQFRQSSISANALTSRPASSINDAGRGTIFSVALSSRSSEGIMPSNPSFETTVKNLLKMKPKPHKEDSGSSESQSEDDQSSSKRATKERNSGDD